MPERQRRKGITWLKAALVVAVLVALAALWLSAAPWYLAPYEHARGLERANQDLAAELSQIRQETETLERRAREPKDRWEAERRLREKGFVKPGEVLLRGREVGATDP